MELIIPTGSVFVASKRKTLYNTYTEKEDWNNDRTLFLINLYDTAKSVDRKSVV